MSAIAVVIIIIIGLIAKAVYDKWSIASKLRRRLLQTWGIDWHEDISYERMNTISSYYESICQKNLDIDDITWNDLDMETLFYQIDRTESAIGEEYLYALLRKPIITEEEWAERKRLIELFQNNESAQREIGTIFAQMGKLKKISVYEYLNYLDSCKPGSSLFHVCCMLALFAAVGITIYNPYVGLASIFVVVAINMVTYYKEKDRIGKYYDVLNFVLRMLYGTSKLSNCEIVELRNYKNEAKRLMKEFRGFKRGSFLVASNVDGGSLFDIVLDYIQMLTHVDLLKFNQMVQTLQKKRQQLNEIFTTVGVLDAMRAIASYREYIGSKHYGCPEFVKGTNHIHVEGLFHPMLEHPVKADFDEARSVLITGSNASGKSTFLKAVALNAVLSQTICTSMAKSYQAPRFKIFSSMALSDNIFENESYFIVEIKSLKRILDTVEEEIPTLCFVDEVLRGTNTLERIAASSQILLDLSNQNVICFSATHDIELTHILENHFSNYHFTEDVIDNEVVFEYKLKNGRATSRNAIKLLSMLGYPSKIVDDANQSTKDYMDSGQWKIFE